MFSHLLAPGILLHLLRHLLHLRVQRDRFRQPRQVLPNRPDDPGNDIAGLLGGRRLL